MKINQVEKRLNVPRTHIRYLQREKLFEPMHTTDNGYRDFSEEDIQNLEMILILMKAGVSAKDVKELQNETCTLEEVLRKTESDMRKKVDELLGGLELIQRLRASYMTYDSLPRDQYWQEIQRKEAKGQHFMGHYVLEDVSDWAELKAEMERIIECPSCHATNRIDMEEYVYDEVYEGGDRDDDMGPELTHYFDSEELFRCRKCKTILKVFGWIKEYPVGTFNTEDIKVEVEEV